MDDEAGNYPYLERVMKHLDYLHAGSVFPDWGYLCMAKGGEEAHWEPFMIALHDYIVENYQRGTDEYDKMLAFLFGVISHDYADIRWHWGNQINGVTNGQALMQTMSHIGSRCKDEWDKGSNPTCHYIADYGADFYLGARYLESGIYD